MHQLVKAISHLFLLGIICFNISACQNQEDKKTATLLELPTTKIDSGTAITAKQYMGSIEGKINV